MEPTEIPLQTLPDPFAPEDDSPAVEQEAELAPEPSPEETLATQLADAQTREAEANRRLDEERARFDRLLESAPSPAPPPIPTVDPHNVPDPLSDTDAFVRHQGALREQEARDLERKFEERLQGVQSQLSQQQTLDSLWHQFQSSYPDMAGLEKLAGYAFTEVTGGALPGDTTGLIDRVHDKMIELSGGNRLSPTTTNRTGGVSGGNTTTPAPPTPPAPQEEKITTLADSLHEWQHEQGYI